MNVYAQRILFLCIVFLSNSLKSQDEVFFRKIFSGEMTEQREKNRPISEAKYWDRTGAYQLDLNGDGHFESLIASKSDGKDYFEIRDQNGVELNRFVLRTLGRESTLYRIRMTNLSPISKVIVLYFYEGFVDYINFESSGRAYFLTMDQNDLTTLKLQEGPAFWLERERLNFQYVNRHYNLKFEDLNQDGIREIIAGDNKVKRVYFYEGKGQWKSL